ncbi:MAG TPA: RNA polymerase sigma factor SigZ [Ktedonobacterales bacterium]|nr:RNA polymerase sigma factor SigZ [Ktedonobacterales bacterium]
MTTEQVWEAYHVPLRQFIRAQVRDEQQTDDLLQEVFLKIHTDLDTVRAPEKVGSWLYQIARHVITDHYRLQRSKATIPLSDELVERLAIPEEAEENEAVQRLLPYLLPLVQCLPRLYRQALLLTEVEGLTQKALAEQLGLSFSGAKSRVQRARDQLRKLLSCCHFAFDRRGQIIDYSPRGEHCASGACGAKGESRVV